MATLAHNPNDERRQRILRCATTLFAEQGFQNTTMDHVAAAVGFTKPILYQHVDSKDALYAEIVSGTAERLLNDLAEVMRVESSPRARIEAAFLVYFTLVVRDSDAFKVLFLQNHASQALLSNAGHEHPLRSVESSLVAFIEPLLADDLSPAHAVLLAGAIVGMAEGAAVVWLVQNRFDATPRDLDQEARQLARHVSDLVWGGLRSVRAN